MMKIALVVEFGDSHTELLYSHKVLLEDAGYQIVFFLNEKLKSRVSDISSNEILFFNESESRSKTLQSLFKLLKSRQIKLMIDNSAHSNYIRDFLPYKFQIPGLFVVGVCHYVKKLSRSLNQWFISRVVDKYLVLSSLFFENGSLRRKANIGIFYPVYFDNLPQTPLPSFPLEIVVLGGINLRSKDYPALYNAIKANSLVLEDKVHITFLGNGSDSEGKEFQSLVRTDGLSQFFTFFSQYVDLFQFRETLSRSHLVAPLINPSLAMHKDYLNSKISGSYNVAYGFKIPMLLDSYFKAYSDFNEFAIFYHDISQTLLNIDCEQILDKKNRLLKETRYDFQRQKEFYQSFVCS